MTLPVGVALSLGSRALRGPSPGPKGKTRRGEETENTASLGEGSCGILPWNLNYIDTFIKGRLARVGCWKRSHRVFLFLVCLCVGGGGRGGGR